MRAKRFICHVFLFLIRLERFGRIFLIFFFTTFGVDENFLLVLTPTKRLWRSLAKFHLHHAQMMISRHDGDYQIAGKIVVSFLSQNFKVFLWLFYRVQNHPKKGIRKTHFGLYCGLYRDNCWSRKELIACFRTLQLKHSQVDSHRGLATLKWLMCM